MSEPEEKPFLRQIAIASPAQWGFFEKVLAARGWQLCLIPTGEGGDGIPTYCLQPKEPFVLTPEAVIGK